MRPGEGRVAVRGAFVLLVCTLLAGCSVLASDQSIRPGLSIGRDSPEQDLQVDPAGPAPSAEPIEIVAGFIQALAGSSGEFVAAREFLTDEAARAWSPEARTVVFRRSAQITQVSPSTGDEADDEGQSDENQGDDEAADPLTLAPGADDIVMRVSAAVWAEVSRTGHFRELPVEEQLASEVVLTEVGGQWRISQLDSDFGRWLGTADFERLYDAYPVHYVARTEPLLVPDVRYVPTDRVATRLAMLQLEAPPDYLAEAVRNDLPPAARLAVGAVPVVGGVARVDLSGDEIGEAPESRSRIWAQFVATMTQIRGVERVQLTLEGNPMDIPGIEEVRALEDLGFAGSPPLSPATPLIRQGVHLGQFAPRALVGDSPPEASETDPPDGGFPPIELDWQHLTLSHRGDEVAGVSGDMMSRWRADFRYEVPGFATELGRPCYDRYDTLWVGGVSQGDPDARLFAVNAWASPADPARSAAVPVQAPWLAERRVLACQVSPQGTRIAILSDGGPDTRSRIDIGAIYREPTLLPTVVVGPQVIGEHFASMTDAVWLTETTMAVLGQTRANAALAVEPADNTDPVGASGSGDESAGARGTLPYLITVGGRTTALPPLPGGSRITSTGGERNLIVIGGVVHVRAGSQWLPALEQGEEVMVGAR